MGIPVPALRQEFCLVTSVTFENKSHSNCLKSYLTDHISAWDVLFLDTDKSSENTLSHSPSTKRILEKLDHHDAATVANLALTPHTCRDPLLSFVALKAWFGQYPQI
jgi:hypothetical protein